MSEGDLREEDKEEGRGLGEGSLFWGKLGEEEGKEEIMKERGKKEEIGGHRLFWGAFTRALVLLGLWARGLGNHKDSWSKGAREVVPSWLGGKYSVLE